VTTPFPTFVDVPDGEDPEPGVHTDVDAAYLNSVNGAINTIQNTLPGKVDASALAQVATTGAYTDLIGAPFIPNSPDDIGAQPAGSYATTASLATVATTGAYTDLTGKPTIPSTPADVGLGNVANAAQVQLGTVTTKGDLVAGTGAATVARLPVGANGQVLQANSGTATGLQWGAMPPPSGTATGLFNVKLDFGALGNGVANDAAAIQAAIDACEAAGGGTVFFPAGTYMVGSGLTVNASHVVLKGESRGATVLEKTAAFPLVQFAGTAGPETHVTDGGIQHMTLRGGDQTGTLIDALYGTRLLFEDLHLFGNNDIGIDMVELWDSRFVNVYVEWCSGTSTTAPGIYVRSSRAASGAGSSTDSTNQILFIGCLVEGWRGGAIRVDQGVGSPANIYGIHFVGTKIETWMVRGPAISVGTSASNVSFIDTYIYLDSFDAGYSTPVDAIVLGGDGMNTVQNCYIGVGGQVLASGVNVSGPGATLTNVEGFYDAGAPTSGSHVRVTGGTNYTFGHLRSSNATNQLSGLSTTAQANSGAPITAVAGAVSNASFPDGAPAIGTLGLDTTNNRLYVKTGATTWRYTTLT
jgi:hypothetical protein